MKKILFIIMLCFISSLHCASDRTQINIDYYGLIEMSENGDQKSFNGILDYKFTKSRPDGWTEERILNQLSTDMSNVASVMLCIKWACMRSRKNLK